MAGVLHRGKYTVEGVESRFKSEGIDDIESFFRGVANSRSIQELSFYDSQFGAGCARQLSLALRGCVESVKTVRLVDIYIDDGQLVEIVEGLSTIRQLEILEFECIDNDTNDIECLALANLLRSTANLHTLGLCGNDIDDEGMATLVEGALSNRRLCKLSLSSNHITGRGCQTLAMLLERPNSSLEEIYLANNDIGDEGALIFANALVGNYKLKIIYLLYSNNGITAEGWGVFSKALCDTSTLNKTFLSNHTLEILGEPPNFDVQYVSDDESEDTQVMSVVFDIEASLELNRSSNDKRQVAIKKILKHHHHFDMQPFLKVLPISVLWFERARSVARSIEEEDQLENIQNVDEAGIDKRKLSVIYQFIRAMPEVFEPVPVMPNVFEPAFE